MKTFSLNEINTALGKTPKSIEEMLFSPSLSNILGTIVKKYSLTTDTGTDIAAAIFYYLTKLISDQELVNVIGSSVPQKHFAAFMNDLESMLWSPFDVYLSKGDIIYKQLTRFEPQPIKEQAPQPKQAQQTQPRMDAVKTTTPMPLVTPPAQPVQGQPSTSTPSIKPNEPIPGHVPSASQPPKPAPPSTPPELIVIGESPKPAAAPIKPTPPPTFVPTQSPRIKVGDSKISQQTPAVNIPKPPQPVFMGMQFESIQEKPELKQEVQGTSEKKNIQVPPAPIVPTTTMQGKQIIDLTDFSVNNPPENKS